MSLYTLTVDLLAKTGSFERDMGKAARIAERDAAKMAAAFKHAGTVIGTALSGAVITATASIKASINAMDDLSKAAQRANMPTEKFSELAYAASLADVSTQELTGAMGKLAKAQGDAEKATSNQARLFKAMGIEVKTATGQMRDTGDVLGDFADRFKEMKGSPEIMAAGMNIFGRSFQTLIPLIKDGSQGLKDAGDEARRFGLVMTDEAGANAEAFNDNLSRVAAVAQGFTRQVSAELLPDLLRLSDRFVEVASDADLAATAADGVRSSLEQLGELANVGSGVFTFLQSVRDGLSGLERQAVAATRLVLGISFVSGTGSADLLKYQEGTAMAEAAARGVKYNRALGHQFQGVTSRKGSPAEFSGVTSSAETFTAEQMRKLGIQAEADRIKADRARRAEISAALGDDKKAAGGKSGGSAAADRAAESLARYDKQAAMAAATLAGPLQAAEMAHTQRLAEIDAELRKGNMSQAAANVLRGEATAALDKSTAALREQQNAPNALLDTMTGEIRLLGMTGQARELYRRQLENERDMREAINRANEAGAGINDEVTQSLLRQARGWAETSIAAEEAAANAQAWQGVVMGAAGGAADMFADLFSGGIKGTKDFFSELKDIWKRGWWDILRTAAQQNFVNPLQKALAGMMSGQGYAGAGQSGGGWMSQLLGSGKSGGMLETIGGWFGMGGGQQQRAAAAAGGPAWNGMSGGFGWGNVAGSVAGVAGNSVGGGAGDLINIGGQMYMAAGTKTGAGFLTSAAAPWLAGAAGAVYGWKQGGDTTGKALGAAAYGAAGYGVMAGVGGAVAGSAVAGSAAAGLAAVPVVGWIALAAIAIDKLSGGKLFGTKYQAEQVTQNIGIGPDGGMASASVYERGQKSLFGGVKRRDRNIDPSQEMLDAADEIYDAMEAVAKSVSSTLGIATVDVISGSFKQVYDKKGKLVSEGSTVLGKMYSESVEDFARRLSSEQVIAAVGKIDASASKIAEDWRHSAEVLEAGAAFFMAAAGDARNGLDLWTGVGLQGLTDFVTRMQTGEEAMLATYQRLAGLAGDYGNLMADINTQLLTGDLNTWQQQALAIERTYRQQTKSANDYAKALGLSGARAEDLAKIEELRAVSMGKLQAQMEAEKAASLNNLALSDLSPLRDDQKLAEAMKQLQDAVSAGDIGAANSASQAALGFGRNLYASGKDYNALYQQVTGMIGGMQLGDLALEDGTTMGELADTLEALPEQFGKAIFELAAGMQKETTAATNEVRDAVNRSNELLDQLLQETRKGVGGSSSERLRKELNRQEVVR